MSRKLIGLLTAGGLCLAGATLPAQADNITSSFTTVPQFWLGNLPQVLRLTPANGVFIPFNNPFVGTVSITYTAECQLNGALSSYIFVSVFIDGVITQPTSSEAVFCSGQGGTFAGAARHSITVAKVLASGAHSVLVRGQVVGVHARAHIDDSTILISR